MYIKFEFQITYRFVAVNKSTNEYVCGFEVATKKKVKNKILDVKDIYKKSDGWKLSCERCIRLVLGNKEKMWYSELYDKPDYMKDHIIDNPFVSRFEPKFTLNPWG